jgi:hypothetical protein
MRTALCFAMLLIPTIALAQGATPPKRPTVGTKPLVSGEAEGARWLQARWNGQRDEALGGRMHGDAGAKNRYASRSVESDVGPRCDGRGHSEGSAVTPQFMCNLYSITTNQAATAALFRVMNRQVGNLPPMPGVFPDYPAPVVRNAGTERELSMMRWRMPPPPQSPFAIWDTGHEFPH